MHMSKFKKMIKPIIFIVLGLFIFNTVSPIFEYLQTKQPVQVYSTE
jgi:cadmium resistance protein CadD (predicted permease)